MRCESIRRDLHAHRSGLLPPDAAARLTRHLERCAECAAQARTEELLASDLSRLRTEAPFTISIEDRVMARIATRPLGARRPVGWRQLAPWGLAAGLATFVLAGVFVANAPSAGALWELFKPVAGSAWRFAGQLVGPGIAIAKILARVCEVLRDVLVAVDALWRHLEPVARSLILTAIALTLAAASFVVGRELRPVAALKER